MDTVTQSLIHECLSCPSRTIEEKCSTSLKAHRIEDGFVSIELISVEFTKVVICQRQFISFVVCKLFRKEWVFINMGPVFVNVRHVRESRQ